MAEKVKMKKLSIEYPEAFDALLVAESERLGKVGRGAVIRQALTVFFAESLKKIEAEVKEK